MGTKKLNTKYPSTKPVPETRTKVSEDGRNTLESVDGWQEEYGEGISSEGAFVGGVSLWNRFFGIHDLDENHDWPSPSVSNYMSLICSREIVIIQVKIHGLSTTKLNTQTGLRERWRE